MTTETHFAADADTGEVVGNQEIQASSCKSDLLCTGFDLACGPDCTVVQCIRCKQIKTIENGRALPEIGWCGCDRVSA